MHQPSEYGAQHKSVPAQSLLHQDHVIDRRGGRKHSTEQKSVRMERQESSLRRQREQEVKRQAELNA